MSNHEETLKEFEKELENKLRNLVIDGWQMGKEQKLMPYDYRCNSDIAKPVYDYIKLFLLQKLEANDKEWEEKIRRCGVGDKVAEETNNYDRLLELHFEKGFNSANHQWRERILKETNIKL